MLPVSARMHTAADFRATVRSGVRVARRTLVVHARPTDPPSRVGFVVSRAVGNAVTRNRVKRRLRHLVRAELERTESPRSDVDTPPTALDVVIRALPAAAAEPNGLADDLHSAWHAALERAAARS